MGFMASGVAAGIKKKAGALDVALIVSATNCNAAAVFTKNRVKAACVLRGQAQIASNANRMRAVVINAGCANACTGEEGSRNAEDSAAAAAAALGIESADQVMTMSTGVIGVQLPMQHLRNGILMAAHDLSVDGFERASLAIMTTDTVPKTSVAQFEVDGRSFSIAGMAKGSGMIHPDMATMLSVIVTDAQVSPARLRLALRRAANRSFNSISVDGDTSTNDTLLVLANGASGARPSEAEFERALTQACIDLATQIARDGEGATKLITIRITGATSETMARNVGRTIATSPLVKTAFYGEDANWGRVLCAAGYSGEPIEQTSASLWFGGVQVLNNGTPANYSEEAATLAMKPRDVEVHLDLGLGQAEALVWTCDLSHEYVTINGRYRS